MNIQDLTEHIERNLGLTPAQAVREVARQLRDQASQLIDDEQDEDDLLIELFRDLGMFLDKSAPIPAKFCSKCGIKIGNAPRSCAFRSATVNHNFVDPVN